eukprot:gnl/TRDRNA2_/TRDRNA2_201375_c0_seq1.p1 gnl/TRDRNA2_/TRDRNA2_201375_c0~~gnl/TRDRNA2_/TRDRNA2_201375_c0_seq1.p1  ORF type:complete len:415 (-),score=61.70 gnl/TRDRNA2_/TRDRNA2_201375_c0_seq1:75-1319(-)
MSGHREVRQRLLRRSKSRRRLTILKRVRMRKLRPVARTEVPTMLEEPPKRLRMAKSTFSSSWLWQLFEHLHEHAGTARGEPLNALVLRLLGSQAVAATCRNALDWACVSGGRRVCTRLNDLTGAPFAPMERLAASLVCEVQLGRDGRDSLQDRVSVITACRRATKLLCTYTSLCGIGRLLDWGAGLCPCLGLRQLRIRQCGIAPDDAVQLLRCAPRLEVAVIIGEQLAGLEASLHTKPPPCSDLRSIEFVDCGLSSVDAAAMLHVLTAVRVARFQAMDLRGLQMPSLPALETLSLLDCNLSRADAVRVMKRCPGVVSLSLCGNPLGAGANEAAGWSVEDGGRRFSSVWPRLPRLRKGDFQFCELSGEDEDALRAGLPGDAQVDFRVGLPDSGGGGHVVFASSSSDDDGADEDVA